MNVSIQWSPVRNIKLIGCCGSSLSSATGNVAGEASVRTSHKGVVVSNLMRKQVPVRAAHAHMGEFINDGVVRWAVEGIAYVMQEQYLRELVVSAE